MQVNGTVSTTRYKTANWTIDQSGTIGTSLLIKDTADNDPTIAINTGTSNTKGFYLNDNTLYLRNYNTSTGDTSHSIYYNNVVGTCITGIGVGLFNNNGRQLSLTSSNNILIGTTSDNATDRLQVSGSIRASTFRTNKYTITETANNLVIQDTDGNPAMTLFDSGITQITNNTATGAFALANSAANSISYYGLSNQSVGGGGWRINTSGSVDFYNVNGSLNIFNATAGNVNLSSAVGSVGISSTPGPVNINSTNGSVNINTAGNCALGTITSCTNLIGNTYIPTLTITGNTVDTGILGTFSYERIMNLVTVRGSAILYVNTAFSVGGGTLTVSLPIVPVGSNFNFVQITTNDSTLNPVQSYTISNNRLSITFSTPTTNTQNKILYMTISYNC